MSELCYKIEPSYCGDCISFQNECDGYGSCNRYDEEAWQGEIACENFINEDEGDGD